MADESELLKRVEHLEDTCAAMLSLIERLHYVALGGGSEALESVNNIKDTYAAWSKQADSEDERRVYRIAQRMMVDMESNIAAVVERSDTDLD